MRESFLGRSVSEEKQEGMILMGNTGRRQCSGHSGVRS